MFDFSDESKRKYYDKANAILKENDLECLKIDTDQIAYLGKDKQIKIFLIPFTKKTVSSAALSRAKHCKDIVITNDRYSKTKQGTPKMMRENGHILLDLDEEDL